MKLLFDQNLSPRLVDRLADLYPDAAHVGDVDLAEAPDPDVWRFARVRGYLIVSKDADFSEMTVVHGFPPKVIWIRRGNCSTNDIEAILRQGAKAVKALQENESAGILLLD